MLFHYNQNKHDEYNESGKVQQYYNDLQDNEENKPVDWTGGTYGDSLKNVMGQINNREKFSYDVNADALYQQYKDKYVNLGKQAMQDTMGQASALTGGQNSTYAQSAGQQQYNSYMQQLSDKVPELYQMAYSRYNQQGNDLRNQYNMLNDQYNREYGQYRDTVGDWENQNDYLNSLYQNERNFDYSKYSDDRNFAYNQKRDQIADMQWAASLALNMLSSLGSLGMLMI